MKLTILGSGSKGNCYLFQPEESEGCSLLIEAGVQFREVTKAVKGRIQDIGACLITHEHKDHAGCVREVIDHGVPVFATAGTKQEVEKWPRMQLAKGRIKVMTIGRVLQIGGFSILPFKAVHDAAEPCAFYIYHAEMGFLVFATDTAYIPNRFKCVSNILIECNYEEKKLAARTDIPDEVKDRIRANHMSIDTCIEALDSLISEHTLYKIVLIHISEVDGDETEFVEKVYKGLKVPRFTGSIMSAHKGLEVYFSDLPF